MEQGGIKAIQSTPWQWKVTERGPTAVIPPLARDEALPAPPVAPAEYNPRRINLTREMFEKYGYIAGCRRCTLTRESRSIRGTTHRDDCRRRIEIALREDGDDERIVAADNRIMNEAARRTQPAEEENEEVDRQIQPNTLQEPAHILPEAHE